MRDRAEITAARDEDRDALHILPLSIIPLESRTLARSRMIKNTRLESVIELFSDDSAGSGQVPPDQIGKLFNLEHPETHPDFKTIRQLSLLPSYDVYSLRIGLRNLGIDVNDHSELKLSDAREAQLSNYMKVFTRPLLHSVYGAGREPTEVSGNNIVELFRSPDIVEVRDKLHELADRLGVSIEEVPEFLEDYGDVYLSVAYYKYCLDQMMPELKALIASINQIRTHQRLRSDPQLIQSCEMIEERFKTIAVQISRMINSFIKSTSDMWGDISALRFRRMEQLIMNYNLGLGGALCGINVKISNWQRAFPNPEAGGPVRRAKFIMTEMRPGIELIKELEDATPRLALI